MAEAPRCVCGDTQPWWGRGGQGGALSPLPGGLLSSPPYQLHLLATAKPHVSCCWVIFDDCGVTTMVLDEWKGKKGSKRSSAWGHAVILSPSGEGLLESFGPKGQRAAMGPHWALRSAGMGCTPWCEVLRGCSTLSLPDGCVKAV